MAKRTPYGLVAEYIIAYLESSGKTSIQGLIDAWPRHQLTKSHAVPPYITFLTNVNRLQEQGHIQRSSFSNSWALTKHAQNVLAEERSMPLPHPEESSSPASGNRRDKRKEARADLRDLPYDDLLPALIAAETDEEADDIRREIARRDGRNQDYLE